MEERAMRPFWIHQAVEYLIGIALVSQALQDPNPVIPSVVATMVILNAAIVRGPLGAFKWVSRGMHRWFDVGMMGVILVTALQPWTGIGTTARAMMLVTLVPLAFLWYYTDWAERPARKERRKEASTSPTGEQIGRTAGRAAATGYLAARQAIKKRSG